MKGKILMLITLLLVIMAVGVNATLTMNYPVSASFLTTATERIQVTVTGLSGALGNVSGWNVSYRSGDSGDWTFALANTTNNNLQNNQTLLIDLVDFSAVADGTNYDINVTAFNVTGQQESVINDDVDVDNGNPTVSSSAPDQVVVGSGEAELNCAGTTDAVDGALNYSLKLLDPDSVLVRISTDSVFNFRDGDFATVGSYTFNCGALDSSGNSANQTRTILSKNKISNVKKYILTSGGDRNVPESQVLKPGVNPIYVGAFLLVLVAVASFGYFMFFRK